MADPKNAHGEVSSRLQKSKNVHKMFNKKVDSRHITPVDFIFALKIDVIGLFHH